MASENLHSRVVVILKITLPLVALAILSSLFLFSRPIDPEDAIPYAEVEIADRLAQPRMSEAGFSTVTSDGATLTLSAKRAAPQTGGATVDGLTGRLVYDNGTVTEIEATTGVLDRQKANLVLSDGVRLTTSTGYTVDAESLTMGTDRSFLESGGPVSAAAPIGTLSAGGMRISRASSDAPYLLVFNKGVRLIYQPQP